MPHQDRVGASCDINLREILNPAGHFVKSIFNLVG